MPFTPNAPPGFAPFSPDFSGDVELYVLPPVSSFNLFPMPVTTARNRGFDV
jgi:hypothetical protein